MLIRLWLVSVTDNEFSQFIEKNCFYAVKDTRQESGFSICNAGVLQVNVLGGNFAGSD